MEKVIVLGYIVELVFDKEDKIYVANAVALPGCMTHGDTLEAAVAEMKIAIKSHINTARDNKVKVAEPMSIYA